MRNRGRTSIQLEMPSRIEMLEKVGDLVGQAAEFGGFDEESRLDIVVAVHEAVVNAIRHGNCGDEARRVTVDVDVDHGGIGIRVRDQGDGFDPDGVPDPLRSENLCRSSGRGILLMKALMDAVAFCSRPGEGTEVAMSRRLPGPSAAQWEPARTEPSSFA